MNDFSSQQMEILQRLIAKEFVLVAFPLYANAVGVRQGSCAALLNPVANGGFTILGEPCILLDGNLTVRIKEKDKTWFVWKKQRVEATAERISELQKFIAELKLSLEPHIT
ncbi:MAG TPA: hypothetical protein VFE02_19490 [Candidatus Acidoferrales bacterium]|jgi:hypothetical protein|nr:hypothetical protein [Candidatus Acidoferrales bacterium]